MGIALPAATIRFTALFGTIAVCVSVAAAETVTFPGKDVTLRATLARPASNGPFPAVIALHGCGGLYDKTGALSPRHADWADRLVAEGFVVLMPDSFGSRGAKSQCRTDDRVTRPSRERVEDVLAARAYLQSRTDIRANSIALLGWSNGGSTVLYAVQTSRLPKDGRPDFVRSVAFYPGCRVPAERGKWHARLPLMILIGAADDWTPAAPCETLATTAKAANEPVSIVVYPGAYHDFDHPNLPVHSVKGLAYTANRNGLAHTGTNPAARQDALMRVLAFLSR